MITLSTSAVYVDCTRSSCRWRAAAAARLRHTARHDLDQALLDLQLRGEVVPVRRGESVQVERTQLSASVTTSCSHSTRRGQRLGPAPQGGSGGVRLGGGGGGGGLGGGDGVGGAELVVAGAAGSWSGRHGMAGAAAAVVLGQLSSGRAPSSTCPPPSRRPCTWCRRTGRPPSSRRPLFPGAPPIIANSSSCEPGHAIVPFGVQNSMSGFEVLRCPRRRTTRGTCPGSPSSRTWSASPGGGWFRTPASRTDFRSPGGGSGYISPAAGCGAGRRGAGVRIYITAAWGSGPGHGNVFRSSARAVCHAPARRAGGRGRGVGERPRVGRCGVGGLRVDERGVGEQGRQIRSAVSRCFRHGRGLGSCRDARHPRSERAQRDAQRRHGFSRGTSLRLSCAPAVRPISRRRAVRSRVTARRRRRRSSAAATWPR